MGHVSRYVSFWVGFWCGLRRFWGRRDGRCVWCVRVWSLRSAFRFSVRCFFCSGLLFFCDFRVFFGGYPPPGPPFPAKGCRRTPRAAQRPFFDDLWWISGSVLGVRGGRFPDFPATFFRWFLGTAPGTLFGGFWVDFGRFFGAIWVPFWRSLDFVIL